MNTIQVINITVDELADQIVARLPVSSKQKGPVHSVSGIINVLDKRNAARTLNISESLFDKFYQRGMIPCGVCTGIGKNRKPIRRWAEHHLLLIKPIIQKMRWCQSEVSYSKVAIEIRNILGL
jgi:hypothetical protein